MLSMGAEAAHSTQRALVSRTQVETLVSRAVAVFGLVFGAQTLPVMFSQLGEVSPIWAATFVPVFYATLVAALVASVAQRRVRAAHGAVAVVYCVGILTWPLVTTSITSGGSSTDWLYYLLSVATAMAAIAFPRRIALAYLVLVPSVMAVVRVVSDAVPAADGVLDSIYAIILGGAIVVIVVMLRQAASSVDRAQEAALDTYGIAVRQHATEVERVQVDAIVHDSVLTTLLSAARAESPEAKVLAATMAGNAIGHLRQAALAGPGDESTVSLVALTTRLNAASRALGVTFERRAKTLDSTSIPAVAAEAVYSAAVQAMVNSVQHAGSGSEVRRWLGVRGIGTGGIGAGGTEAGGVEVEVGDTGVGFESWAIPRARLGVRVSILERVRNAGGVVELDSALGEGTIVTIRWPAAVAS